MWSGVNTSAPGTRHIFAQCGRDLKFLAVFLSVRRRQCSKQRTLFCYYVRVYKGVDLIYSIDKEIFARRRREKEAAISKRLQGMSLRATNCGPQCVFIQLLLWSHARQCPWPSVKSVVNFTALLLLFIVFFIRLPSGGYKDSLGFLLKIDHFQ